MDENSVEYYGAYYQGALLAAKKVIDQYVNKSWHGENKVYREAELTLITRDKRSMQLFMEGYYVICYKNHKRNAKGKLIYCEAYFADKRTNFVQVT